MNPKKILLAEDDLDDQKLFHEFLYDRKDIILMHAVENGIVLFDVLEKIADEADLPHLIVLDQNMPKRNGLQALQLLKQNPRYRHIPIMIYSTYTDEQLINNSMNAGASLVMQKPITKDGYHEMISAFLTSLG